MSLGVDFSRSASSFWHSAMRSENLEASISVKWRIRSTKSSIRCFFKIGCARSHMMSTNSATFSCNSAFTSSDKSSTFQHKVSTQIFSLVLIFNNKPKLLFQQNNLIKCSMKKVTNFRPDTCLQKIAKFELKHQKSLYLSENVHIEPRQNFPNTIHCRAKF